MPTTPQEWLPVLTKRLDQRVPRIRRLRNYANGNADLPEMGKNLRASWEKFQRKARTNFGGLCVESLADRIKTNGLAIGKDREHPALGVAERLWRDNRLDVQVPEAIEDYLVCGIGYLVVGRGTDGHAVVTRERPEDFYADVDPLRPWKARAAVKAWRDSVEGVDYVKVWTQGLAVTWSRPSKTDSGSTRAGSAGEDWAERTTEVYEGDPPVVVLERKGGVGLFEPHIDVIDRINLGKLNRLVIAAMQAFRQRALKQASADANAADPMPEHDEDGNAIDYAKLFEPAPGALWELPAGIDIWESTPSDLTSLLTAEKADARDFAAVSRTPISVFIPEGANQSAEGASSAKEGQVSRASAEIARLSPALAVMVVYMLRVEDVALGPDETVEVLWTPPEHVSLTERYAAAQAAKGAGESWRSIARNILGYSPDQIAQDELDRAAEMLAAASMVSDQAGGDGKARADMFGVLVRSGVAPEAAATAAGLDGLEYTGAIPVALRVPESQAATLEEK